MRLLKSSIGSRIGEGKHTDAGEMTFVPGRGRGINHRSVYHRCSCRGSRGGQNARNGTETRSSGKVLWVKKEPGAIKLCKKCPILSLLRRCSSVASKQKNNAHYFLNDGVWNHQDVEFTAEAIKGLRVSWGQDGCRGSTYTTEKSIRDWKHVKNVYGPFKRIVNLSWLKEVSRYRLYPFYYASC